MLEPLHRLTSTCLRQLATELSAGVLATKVSNHHVVRQIVGSAMAEEINESLASLSSLGWTNTQIATLVSAIQEARERAAAPESILDVVLTGPEITGVPTRDTAAVMHTLIETAEQEVILVGYAVYNGKKLFQRLAERMRQNPQLCVSFLLNIQRKYGDTSLPAEIVRRFAMDFALKHWPWTPRPDIYYDPRSLDLNGAARASLHAKCLIIDRRAAMITSANFTEAAHERNIEAGVVVTYEPFVCRIADYFAGLRQAVLEKCVEATD